jgi:hypothetical protein
LLPVITSVSVTPKNKSVIVSPRNAFIRIVNPIATLLPPICAELPMNAEPICPSAFIILGFAIRFVLLNQKASESRYNSVSLTIHTFTPSFSASGFLPINADAFSNDVSLSLETISALIMTACGFTNFARNASTHRCKRFGSFNTCSASRKTISASGFARGRNAITNKTITQPNNAAPTHNHFFFPALATPNLYQTSLSTAREFGQPSLVPPENIEDVPATAQRLFSDKAKRRKLPWGNQQRIFPYRAAVVANRRSETNQRSEIKIKNKWYWPLVIPWNLLFGIWSFILLSSFPLNPCPLPRYCPPARNASSGLLSN